MNLGERRRRRRKEKKGNGRRRKRRMKKIDLENEEEVGEKKSLADHGLNSSV